MRAGRDAREHRGEQDPVDDRLAERPREGVVRTDRDRLRVRVDLDLDRADDALGERPSLQDLGPHTCEVDPQVSFRPPLEDAEELTCNNRVPVVPVCLLDERELLERRLARAVLLDGDANVVGAVRTLARQRFVRDCDGRGLRRVGGVRVE